MNISAKKMKPMRSTLVSQTITAPKTPLTFGDFVAGGYRAWGKREAPGLIGLAARSQMILISN